MSLGRPATYTDETTISICTKDNRSKLQENSERRAIINYIIDVGGKATLADIDSHFGYDIREKVIRLIRAKWLEVA